jgi:hypothetical protein
MSKLLVFLIFFSGTVHAQMISGTLKDEGRKIVVNPGFVIEGMTNGYANYELAVNREGDVTSIRFIETNLKSTPAKFEIRNYVTGFKFEKGTHFPKFHHVIVKITMVKPKLEN